MIGPIVDVINTVLPISDIVRILIDRTNLKREAGEEDYPEVFILGLCLERIKDDKSRRYPAENLNIQASSYINTNPISMD